MKAIWWGLLLIGCSVLFLIIADVFGKMFLALAWFVVFQNLLDALSPAGVEFVL